MKIEKLSPAFKDYLWGGTKLRDKYGKESDLPRLAESWELSAHPAGESRISGGEFDGLTLSEYIEKNGKGILGKDCETFDNFPVLIKFIDAKEPLSVQVHPTDEYALRVEGEYGKTEMWYVVDCDAGASLFFGVNREVSKEEFARRVKDNTLTEILRKVEVHKGDVFFIEAGTVHAIGAGILVCEVQQNSNTTYRVYDYGRRGDDGKLRELHVEKALEVSMLAPSEIEDSQNNEEKLLAKCEYFTAEKLCIDGAEEIIVGADSFVSLISVSGNGRITGTENEVEFSSGESFFIPADAGKIKISGKAELIKTTV